MEEYPGLLNWANSVRHNMANDPGRQLFKDQVQTHGFSFLDDYLDGIISGRKQDPLIDLVKTPGRKKVASKNSNLMSSMLVPLVLPQILEMSPIQPLQYGNDTSLEDKINSTLPMDIPLDSPGEHIQQIETLSQTNEPIINHNEVPEVPVLPLLNNRDHVMTDIPEEVVVEIPQELIDKPEMSPKLQHGNDKHIQQIETFPPTTEVLPVENHNELPEMPALQLLDDRDHVLTDIQEEVVEMPENPTDKPNPPAFPTLPEPMPLRKSMKPPRDPSMNAILLGAATPAAAVGGKRTSWLMKAREAKALDGLSKKSHPPGMGSGVGASSSLTLQSSKRKSDHFSLPQLGIRDDERPSKLAKTSDGELFSYDSKHHSSIRTPGPVNMVATSSTESQSLPRAITESAQEGVFDRLRKTVEDLGVRVGKTVGKSVGSDTATVLAEVAEARAAAKAKVAERDRKEEELTIALPAPEIVEHDTATRQENQTRLSITDLFPAEGRVKEKHKAREKPLQFMPNTGSAAVQATTGSSTSTTPPHSPPLQPHSSAIPSGPVFKKPSPVFVPPVQVATKPIASTVLKSTSQSTTALGLSPRLALSPPKALPLTAHSTLESIGSDAVFDRDDVPAWMPSTQDTECTTYDSQSQPQINQILGEEDNGSVDEQLEGDAGASKDSSQSEGGFLGHASKLLSSALGTSKKGKQPEVKKVLQMAAVAAKKQQEEADKKVARLKEMESRRQLAIQRKAEEEKAKVVEEERKMKEEADRRKREREELTDKRPLKPAGKKKEDENLKKRKIEVEKKQEIKKPSASILVGKAHLKSALKPLSVANPSQLYDSLSQSAASAPLEPSFSNYKGKTRLAQNPVDDGVSQPSTLVQSQMAARVKAQINAAKRVEPAIPSENIELPEINSEYSDSEDEDRVRTFDPPEWAQSPELRQALEMQSTLNPDDIFGAVRPLRMEEIFKSRTSRFRARTSSANWTGTDRLTMQEEKEYARRMGFK